MASTRDRSPHLPLGDLIAQQIAERFDRRLTFAEFMEWALYHPQHGYYSTRAVAIGSQGDFFTAPHLGADFGELLAEQFADMWEVLQRPTPFTLVEMGAGQGLLASDILSYLQRCHPQCFQALNYVIVERTQLLIAAQRQQLNRFVQAGVEVSWRSLDEIPRDSIVGCFFSNELVDAFPVHLVEFEDQQLREVYVTLAETSATQFETRSEPQFETHRFTEILGDLSTPRLADYFQFTGIDLASASYPNRYRTEINLAALDWLQTVADRLHRGFVLTIDYGYPAQRYYGPRRSQGTLQCYYQHTHHSDPYIHIGEQDITAHVNFTALERQGDRAGLETIGLTQQGLFLMALGLGDRLAEMGRSQSRNPQDIQTALQRRDALHQLITPMGMGEFGVLVQSKGLSDRPTLKGLSLPDRFTAT